MSLTCNYATNSQLLLQSLVRSHLSWIRSWFGKSWSQWLGLLCQVRLSWECTRIERKKKKKKLYRAITGIFSERIRDLLGIYRRECWRGCGANVTYQRSDPVNARTPTTLVRCLSDKKYYILTESLFKFKI